MRRKLVIGNWKLNGSLQQNQTLISELVVQLQTQHAADFAVCVPFTYLFQAQALLTGSNILWGAQNASQFESGAYTSSISAHMIAEFACKFVIIGHSERRTLSNESNQKAARRIARVVDAGLTPIYCVGESLEERNAGISANVVKNQILAITHGLEDDVFERAKKVNMVIAYEPVWAIGNGQAATPSQAQDMHMFIRDLIAKVDADFAQTIRIIYGGSMTPANASALLSMPDVDGGLIGRCALSAEEFSQICLEANQLGLCAETALA
jgi:triosephosphate isomerase (TIM)